MYDFGNEELKALEDLFKRKKLYRYNSDFTSECDLFEKEFCAVFNVKYSLILSSGTNALIAALLSLQIQPGDEVIVPVYTFFATINAVLAVGATPILVENDAELGYNLNQLKEKISSKTKAVIVVHMDGLVSNVDLVRNICDSNQIFLIEDVAQSLGAELNGKNLGTIGHVGCFSLNENKVLTCGEGGILVTNDPVLFERAYCTHDTPSQFSPSRKNFYQHIKPFVGMSMRVSEIHGAIMRVQLKKLPSILKKLRALKNIYREYLSQFMILGHSSDGDCGTTVHIKFNSNKNLIAAAEKIRALGYQTQPLIGRPAHVAWKWHHLINESTSAVKYSLLDFTNSIEFLTTILRIDLHLEETLDEAHLRARNIEEILKNS